MSVAKDAPIRKTKRTLEAERTKERLYDAAVRLFTTNEFDEVTVDAITKYAGVSKGSFYTYFDSKEAVLVELFKKIDGSYVEAFETADPDLSAVDMLALLYSVLAQYCEEDCGVGVIKVVYRNQLSNGPHKVILANRERPLYGILESIAFRGMSTGELPQRAEPADLIEMLVKTMRGYVFEWCLYDGTRPMIAEPGLSAKIALGGIRAFYRERSVSR